MKRIAALLFSALLAVVVATVIPQAASARAASGCSTSWHYIKAGEVGRNVKPNYWTLYAMGGSDTWNQQFTFCHNAGMAADEYFIYSNARGRYWNSLELYPYVGATASNPNIVGLFEVKRYNSQFWTIATTLGFNYVYADANSGYALRADRGSFLGGDNLFVITPNNLLG
jgi:hypothetical protein